MAPFDNLSVDLRSDTVTRATSAMRFSMSFATTDDMLYRCDDNLNKLECLLSDLFGMTAVWMPSCTMANLVALLICSTRPGAEIILGEQSHINIFERKNAASYGGFGYLPLPDRHGRIDVDQIAEALVFENEFFARKVCLCLENTHNLSGGLAFPKEYLASVCDLSRSQGVRVHIDGARIFNASVFCGEKLNAWAMDVGPQSMSISLSKALGTPAGGALLLQSSDESELARRIRKSLGGTMHTGAGYLAAAAVAVLGGDYYEKVVPQISRDHLLAKNFASELSNISGCQIVNDVQTNIVYASVQGKSPTEVMEILKKEKIYCSILSPSFVGVSAKGATKNGAPVRFVFHRGITAVDVERVIGEVFNMCNN